MNKIGKLNEKTTALFVCDMQQYYLKSVSDIESIIINNKCLINVSKELDIPVIMTKHDPTVYGEIIDDLKPSQNKVFEKTKYSMYNSNLKEYIDEYYPHVTTIILTGLESHVCIVQTALDLIEIGYSVHVISDATGATNFNENKVCIKRMKQSGTFITTTEACCFQLLTDDIHPKSKQIIDIISTRNTELVTLSRQHS